jgi:hypothetical protein
MAEHRLRDQYDFPDVWKIDAAAAAAACNADPSEFNSHRPLDQV